MPSSDLFLRACRGERVERVPIWIMRQAGRYLPEYRALRAKVDFLTLCRTPELAAEATIQPIDRLGVDAAILFSDILVPVAPMGVSVDFDPAPVLDPVMRSASDVERLRVPEPEAEVPFVFEALRIVRRELGGRVPVIGFGGAPLTLAAYMVEGRGSKNFDRVKAMAYGEPRLFHRLLETITQTTERYLEAQVRAGAQAIQLFDTWSGLFPPETYREFGLRYAKRVLDRLAPLGVPRIYFALDGAHLFEAIAECGADVLGVDWRSPLDAASRRLGSRYVLQGNLDPCELFTTRDRIRDRVGAILAAGRAAKGHVFNLGHGILPGTPVENAMALVEAVREMGTAGRA